MKLFNLTVEDLKEIDKKRNEEAHKKKKQQNMFHKLYFFALS